MQVTRTLCGMSRPMSDTIVARPHGAGTDRMRRPWRAVAGFVEDLAILGRFAFGREYGLDGAAKF